MKIKLPHIGTWGKRVIIALVLIVTTRIYIRADVTIDGNAAKGAAVCAVGLCGMVYINLPVVPNYPIVGTVFGTAQEFNLK